MKKQISLDPRHFFVDGTQISIVLPSTQKFIAAFETDMVDTIVTTLTGEISKHLPMPGYVLNRQLLCLQNRHKLSSEVCLKVVIF